MTLAIKKARGLFCFSYEGGPRNLLVEKRCGFTWVVIEITALASLQTNKQTNKYNSVLQ